MPTRFVEALHNVLFEFRHMAAWRAAGLLLIGGLCLAAVLWYLVAPYVFLPIDRRDQEILRLTAALQVSRAEVDASAKKIASLEATHAADVKAWQAKQNELEASLTKSQKAGASAAALESARQERDQAKALVDKLNQEILRQIAALQAARAEAQTSKEKLAAFEAALEQSRTTQAASKKAWEANRKELERSLSEKEEQRASLAAVLASVQQEKDRATKRIAELEKQSATETPQSEAQGAGPDPAFHFEPRTLPKCEGGWNFVKQISNEEVKDLLGGPACRIGTAGAYYVCPDAKKFGVRCLTPSDLAKARLSASKTPSSSLVKQECTLFCKDDEKRQAEKQRPSPRRERNLLNE
jgi:hypothetical protein